MSILWHCFGTKSFVAIAKVPRAIDARFISRARDAARERKAKGTSKAAVEARAEHDAGGDDDDDAAADPPQLSRVSTDVAFGVITKALAASQAVAYGLRQQLADPCVDVVVGDGGTRDLCTALVLRRTDKLPSYEQFVEAHLPQLHGGARPAAGAGAVCLSTAAYRQASAGGAVDLRASVLPSTLLLNVNVDAALPVDAAAAARASYQQEVRRRRQQRGPGSFPDDLPREGDDVRLLTTTADLFGGGLPEADVAVVQPVSLCSGVFGAPADSDSASASVLVVLQAPKQLPTGASCASELLVAMTATVAQLLLHEAGCAVAIEFSSANARPVQFKSRPGQRPATTGLLRLRGGASSSAASAADSEEDDLPDAADAADDVAMAGAALPPNGPPLWATPEGEEEVIRSDFLDLLPRPPERDADSSFSLHASASAGEARSDDDDYDEDGLSSAAPISDDDTEPLGAAGGGDGGGGDSSDGDGDDDEGDDDDDDDDSLSDLSWSDESDESSEPSLAFEAELTVDEAHLRRVPWGAFDVVVCGGLVAASIVGGAELEQLQCGVAGRRALRPALGAPGHSPVMAVLKHPAAHLRGAHSREQIGLAVLRDAVVVASAVATAVANESTCASVREALSLHAVLLSGDGRLKQLLDACDPDRRLDAGAFASVKAFELRSLAQARSDAPPKWLPGPRAAHRRELAPYEALLATEDYTSLVQSAAAAYRARQELSEAAIGARVAAVSAEGEAAQEPVAVAGDDGADDDGNSGGGGGSDVEASPSGARAPGFLVRLDDEALEKLRQQILSTAKSSSHVDRQVCAAAANGGRLGLMRSLREVDAAAARAGTETYETVAQAPPPPLLDDPEETVAQAPPPPLLDDPEEFQTSREARDYRRTQPKAPRLPKRKKGRKKKERGRGARVWQLRAARGGGGGGGGGGGNASGSTRTRVIVWHAAFDKSRAASAPTPKGGASAPYRRLRNVLRKDSKRRTAQGHLPNFYEMPEEYTSRVEPAHLQKARRSATTPR